MKLSIDQGLYPVLVRFLVKAFVGIIAVAVLLVIAGTVVRAFLWMFFTFDRAGTFHFPATLLTDGNMKIAGRIGTVDHTVGFSGAYITGGHNGRIHFVDVHRYPIVKNIAFPLKVLTACLKSIPDNAAMELIDIFKSLLKQVSRSLFTLDTAGAIRQYLLILKMLQFFNFLRKIPKIINIQGKGIFKLSQFVFIIGPYVQDDHIFLVLHVLELLRIQVNPCAYVGIDIS